MWESRRYTNDEERKSNNNCYKCKYIKFNGAGYSTCTFRNVNVLTTEAYICDKYESNISDDCEETTNKLKIMGIQN